MIEPRTRYAPAAEAGRPRPRARRRAPATLAGGLLLGLLRAGCSGSASSPGGLAAGGSPPDPDARAVEAVRAHAQPLTGGADDYDALLELIGDASFVLLGEATHGTHEFYDARARITRRLITEKGFSAVAIEGDWPAAERVNRYLQGLGTDTTATQALAGFDRFPLWMWRNEEVQDLVAWLHGHNAGLPAERRVGFYGLDLYSLFGSAEAVVEALEQLDPASARRARERYRCFERFGNDPFAYGLAASSEPRRSCEEEALEQIVELEQRFTMPDVQRALGAGAPSGGPAEDPAAAALRFSALQNARVVRNAEIYYRTVHQGHLSSWNERDRHMSEMLDALALHLGVRGRPPKIVVWAHNTHMGDARLTEAGAAGEWNVGQLMRQRYGGNAVLVGFTTYTGTVLAASAWDRPGRVERLRPALPGSYSALFHDTGLGDFYLPLRGVQRLRAMLDAPRIERAVGVVYLPATERASHYFRALLPMQFDAMIHFDTTRAVTPLP